MKKSLFLAAAVVFCAAGAQAADIQPYVSAKILYSDMKNDMKLSGYDFVTDEADLIKLKIDDKTWGGSFAYGIKSGAVRAEIEANLRGEANKNIMNYDAANDTFDLTKTAVSSRSVMLNVFYDFDTGTKFTPYVGGGIGIAHLKAKIRAEDGKVSKSDNRFAWQLGAGVSYAVTDSTALDLSYRYTDSGRLTVKEYSFEDADKTKIDSTAQEILFGVRYAF